MPGIAQHFADLLLLQLIGCFTGPARQLHKMGDEGVAGVPRKENDLDPAAFGRGDKVLPAQLVPATGLRSLFETIVRINNPRNPRVAVFLWSKRKRVVGALAEIG